jgi:hypothetical protein
MDSLSRSLHGMAEELSQAVAIFGQSAGGATLQPAAL